MKSLELMMNIKTLIIVVVLNVFSFRGISNWKEVSFSLTEPLHWFLATMLGIFWIVTLDMLGYPLHPKPEEEGDEEG